MRKRKINFRKNEKNHKFLFHEQNQKKTKNKSKSRN